MSKDVNGQDVQGQEPNTVENGAGAPPNDGQETEKKDGLFKRIGNVVKTAGSKAKSVFTKKHNVSIADVVIAVGVTAGAAIGIKTIYERGKKDGQKELGMVDDELMLEDKDDIFEASVVEEPETEEVEETEEPEYEETEDDYEEETYEEEVED